MKKKIVYHDWSITDAFVASDEWDTRYYDLKCELEALSEKKIFFACKDRTFAHTYLSHAEDVIRKKGNWESSTISMIRELREAIKKQEVWRVFMQTLCLVTLTSRAGEIPEAAQQGKDSSKSQSNKGKKRWSNKEEILKIRNTKIIEHFRKTKLTQSSFAEKHASEYELKSRQVRKILQIALGT